MFLGSEAARGSDLNRNPIYPCPSGVGITGINPEAILMMGDHYGHLLCSGLQPSPPSQTPGGLGQR